MTYKKGAYSLQAESSDKAIDELKALLTERVAQVEGGALVESRISDIAKQMLCSGNTAQCPLWPSCE